MEGIRNLCLNVFRDGWHVAVLYLINIIELIGGRTSYK